MPPLEQDLELRVSLDSFDGPFELLLGLIRRNQYPIDALPVVEITSQFLTYVRGARAMDTELAGEFVEVASWLVLLKSRSLLPAAKDEVAPHLELRRALLDHERLRRATEFLGARTGKGRPGSAGARSARGEAEMLAIEEAPTLEEVVDAARRALESARAARSLEASDQGGATVDELIRWVVSRLESLPFPAAVSAVDWFVSQPSGQARAALFLALLELARKGVLLLYQEEDFAPIRVKSLEEAPRVQDPVIAPFQNGQ